MWTGLVHGATSDHCLLLLAIFFLVTRSFLHWHLESRIYIPHLGRIPGHEMGLDQTLTSLLRRLSALST